ncbi:MAG: hypothetical protein PHQ23_05495 [Candidatus Wallbacteria bacterium]|nr:hypothetical protein [Candidatus Wallbacteria bacterium]
MDIRQLATNHSNAFFELREKVIRQNDVYARRELRRLYNDEIAPFVYTGPTFNQEYFEEITRCCRGCGFESITDAYINTPGH